MLENLIIDSLATYRISRLVAREEGPANIFGILRELGGSGGFAEGIKCPLCVSIWAGLAMPFLPRYFKLALAASGAAVILFEYLSIEEDDGDYDAAEAVANDMIGMIDALVSDGSLSDGDGYGFKNYVDSSLAARRH